MSDFNKVLALLGALCFAGVVIVMSARPQPLEGIRGTDLTSGSTVELEDYKGDVVLVQFFATWCGPCMSEFPVMRSVYDRYADDGFRVIAVSLDQNESAVTKFIDSKDVPFPVIFREGTSIARFHNVRSIPRAILVGRDGMVIDSNIRAHQLENEVLAAL